MKIIAALLIVSCLSLLISCSEDDETTSSSTATYTYAGPGSEWSMTRSGTSYTFTMEDGADTLTVNATGEALTSGHIKLTVTDATATGAAGAPSAGDVAHGIEIAGTAFLLLPMEPGAETIAMIESGSCPSTNFDANWVIGSRVAGAANKITDEDGDWYGSISWDTSSGEASFPLQRSVENVNGVTGGEGGSQTIGTCASGRVSTASIDAYFTTSGLVIVATNIDTTDESHIIGIPKGAISTASSIYGDYSGFVFDQENGSSFAAAASFAAGTDHDLSIQVVTGADLTTSGASYTVNFPTANIDAPGDGIMHGAFDSCTGGSVSDFDGNCELACVVAKDVNSSGKNMIYCSGQHPSDEDDRITILLVEQ